MVLSDDPEVRAKQLAKINALTDGKKGVPSNAFETKSERLSQFNKGVREDDLKIHNVRTLKQKDMDISKEEEFTIVSFKDGKDVKLPGRLNEKDAIKLARKQKKQNPSWRS